MEMAMPASDMMLALMSMACIGMNAKSTEIGMVTIGTVADLLDVTAPPNHVLAAGDFEEPPADLAVGAANRVGDVGEAQLVSDELVGVDRDLVLLDEPADRGDLGHAGNRLELIAQEPVL